jgi:hypothetical protein
LCASGDAPRIGLATDMTTETKTALANPPLHAVGD